MTTATVNQHGQITLPAKSRKDAGIQPWSKISIEYEWWKRILHHEKATKLTDFENLFPEKNIVLDDHIIQSASEKAAIDKYTNKTKR